MKRSLYLLFGVLVVDQLDAGMATPLYPLLFTEADSPALLLAGGSPDEVATRGAWFIALLSAAYAIPAFAAQPLLGQLSDRFGRKPMLLASFVSSALSYGVFAWGISAGALWAIVVARVVDGVAAGNILIAGASVADASEGDERTRLYGFFTAALSLGFVLGPLLGGYLGDPEGTAWQGPATAFLVAGGLNVLVVGVFAWRFRETLGDDDRDADGAFAWGRAFRNARAAFADERRRPYYLLLACFIAAYSGFLAFYAVVLAERLDAGPATAGWFFAVLGGGLMLVQVGLVERVERWLGAARTLWAAFLLMGGAAVALAFASSTWLAFACVPLFALGTGLIEPLIQSLLSRTASERDQGRIQGVRGSVDSLARVVPPFLAGPVAAVGGAAYAVAGAGAVAGLGGLLALRLLGKMETGASSDRDTDDDAASDDGAGD